MMLFFSTKSTLNALEEFAEHRPRHWRHRSPYVCMQPGSIRWPPGDEAPHMPWMVTQNSRLSTQDIRPPCQCRNRRQVEATNERWLDEDRFEAFERRLGRNMDHLLDRIHQMEQGYYRHMDDYHPQWALCEYTYDLVTLASMRFSPSAFTRLKYQFFRVAVVILWQKLWFPSGWKVRLEGADSTLRPSQARRTTLTMHIISEKPQRMKLSTH